MKDNARFLWSALFFLGGLACFAAVPWLHPLLVQDLLWAEPYYRCPVPVFSGQAMLRNDSFGKGAFGASRGSSKKPRKHKGIDLLVAVGQPVTASKTGRVSYAGIGKGYGWYVEIRHPDGRLTRYAHLSEVSVAAGQWIAAGQKIGAAGKSGNADEPRMRPHLHFEIRDRAGDVARDPLAGLMDPSIRVR
jgi:murein DD-endopeptidase MepM/ murein hydrolase activator NlpD